MKIRDAFASAWLFLAPVAGVIAASAPTDAALERDFKATVKPFVSTYCVSCHGADKPEAELNLDSFDSLNAVVADFPHWQLVLERLEAEEMPSEKAKKFPSTPEIPTSDASTLAWALHPLSSPITTVYNPDCVIV